MTQTLHVKRGVRQELGFQLGLHVVVFLFYAFDSRLPGIEWKNTAFFLSYAAAASVINYLLLPKFLYQKRVIFFFSGVLFVIAALIAWEELVLEKIYYPDTRAKAFPGVIYSLIEVVPLIGILSAFKFGWDALARKKEVDDLKSLMAESEMQFLKSQINPHFLFNNLNNLYAYAIENSPKTPTIILELSAVLRYMLYECKEDFVPLKRELQQLENFVRLYELQVEHRGTIDFKVPEFEENYEVAPLILIVFIENAFKHSMASMPRDIAIVIEITISSRGELKFMCRNSFQPTSNNKNVEHGIGLENVKKRLALIYPENHHLSIEDNGDQYEVKLTLTLNKSINR